MSPAAPPPQACPPSLTRGTALRLCMGGLVDLLRSLQIWSMRLLLPFIRWRVPVRLLRGTEASSGQEVRILVSGSARTAEYHLRHFFATEPVEESCTHMPVWSVRRHLRRQQSKVDLMLCGLDVISARLFAPRGWMRLPHYVGSWMAVPAEAHGSMPRHSRTDSDFRRVRKQRFAAEFSTAGSDFDYFYTRCYLPLLQQRHGRNAEVVPRWMLRLVHLCGGIHWITRDGERLAGDLVVRRGRTYVPVVTGLLDGREDLLRQGALTALYVHSLSKAHALGCSRISLGGSRPSLHNGVLRYKAKWLDGLMPHAGPFSSNHTLLIHWNRLTPAVAGMLGRGAFIHHEKGGYSALCSFPSGVPLTAQALGQCCHDLKLRGLHRLRILLPGAPPADFECPPEVRLASLASVAQYDAMQILSHLP